MLAKQFGEGRDRNIEVILAEVGASGGNALYGGETSGGVKRGEGGSAVAGEEGASESAGLRIVGELVALIGEEEGWRRVGPLASLSAPLPRADEQTHRRSRKRHNLSLSSMPLRDDADVLRCGDHVDLCDD